MTTLFVVLACCGVVAMGDGVSSSQLTGEAAKDISSIDAIRALLVEYDRDGEAFGNAVAEIAKKYPSKRLLVDRVTAFLDDEHDRMRFGALAMLRCLGSDARTATPIIHRVFRDDRNHWVRARALNTLYFVDKARTATYFAEAARDSDPDVRAVALQCVDWTTMRANAFLPRLEELLRDNAEFVDTNRTGVSYESRPVKYEAIVALGKIGPAARSTLPALRRLLADDDRQDVRRVAAIAVTRIDKTERRGVEYLVTEANEASSDRDRFQAVCGLGDLGMAAKREASATLLRLAQKDSSSLVRLAAAAAIVDVIGAEPPAVAALTAAVSDADTSVQIMALESLKKFGPRAASAVPAITRALDQALDDPKHDSPFVPGNDVRIHAVETLLAIGDTKKIRPILDMAVRRANEDVRSRILPLIQGAIKADGDKKGDK